jgi:group I intron endonuclease
MKYIVYALVNPINHEVFYVGKSSSGLSRPKHHFIPSVLNKSNLPVHNKIKSLKNKGYEPYIEVIEDCNTEEELNIAETYYIYKFKKDEGYSLKNLTTGGEGCSGRKVSDEVKKKLSILYKGRKLSEQTILKLKKVNLGKKLTEFHKEKIRIKSPKRIVIFCVNNGKTYNSIRAAAKDLKLDHRGIARTLKGEYKHYNGFFFKKDSNAN